MKTLWSVVFGLIASTVVLVTSVDAVAAAPSGDTCSVTGTGTAYTVVVNLPSNSPAQGAFAFGAPGGVSTQVVPAQSSPGSVLTSGLPANTTSGLATTAVPGSAVTASLTASGPVSGSFTVVPGNSDGSTWFDPVVCQHAGGTPTVSNKFTVHRPVTYDAKAGVWRERVSVPGPGKVIYVHRTIPAAGTPKPLIWSGNVAVSSASTVTLTLKPTPSGMAALKKAGVIKLKLNIEFSPTGGKPVNKIVPLMLKK